MYTLERQTQYNDEIINIYYGRPPIPTKTCDWLAIRAEDDPDDDPPYGYGATREEALQNLIDAIEMEND